MRIPSHFRSGVLTLPCKNTLGVVIPPYSVMALAPDGGGIAVDKGDSTGSTLGPGVMHVRVRKVLEEDFSIANPSIYVFSQDAPIAAYGTGVCSLSLPSFCQLDIGNCRERGCSLMVQPDSWKLHKGPGLFTLRTWWVQTGANPADVGLVDLGQPVVIWTYRLTEAWSSAQATGKVRPWWDAYSAGDPDVEIYDPLLIHADLTTGDEGYCIVSGSKALAINAPCGSLV